MLKTCCKDGHEVYYYLFGEKHRTAVICLGGPGITLWSPLAEGMKDRYLLVVPDFPRTLAEGNADGETVNIPFLAALAVSVLDQEGINTVGVIGWSMGTQIAIELCRSVSKRVFGLVLLCGTAGRFIEIPSVSRKFPVHFNFANKVPAAAFRLAAHIERTERLRALLKNLTSPSRFAKRFGFIDPLTDDAAFDTVVNEFLSIDLKTYHRYAAATADFDGLSTLNQFQFPVLAVSGEKDLLIPPKQVRAMSDKIPRCEYFEIKSGTHYLPVEYGELLALKLDDFFRKVERR